MDNSFGPAYGEPQTVKPKKEKKKEEDETIKKSKKKKSKTTDSSTIETDKPRKKKKKKGKSEKIEKKTKKLKKSSKSKHRDGGETSASESEFVTHEPPQSLSRKSSAVKVDLAALLSESETNYAEEPNQNSSNDLFGGQTDMHEELRLIQEREKKKVGSRQSSMESIHSSGRHAPATAAVRPGAVSVSAGPNTYSRQGKPDGAYTPAHAPENSRAAAAVRPGAVSVSAGSNTYSRQGKPDGAFTPSAPAHAAAATQEAAVRPGAISVSAGSNTYSRQGKPDGAYRPSAPAHAAPTEQSRPGAVSVSNAAPRGKGRVSSSSEGRVGAVSMSVPAPSGKGSGPSLANASEMYAGQSPIGGPAPRVGAVAVSGAAPRGKGSAPRVSAGSESYDQQRPGAVSVSTAAPRGKSHSLVSTHSDDSNKVGAVAVSSAAPRGKGTAPGLTTSSDNYGDSPQASRPGATSVARAAPQGKRRGSVGSTNSNDSLTLGAVSISTGPSAGKGGHRVDDESSQKGRVSHFPTSDLYASLTSLQNGLGEGTGGKGRISQFPGEEVYEEDDQPTNRRTRTSIGNGSADSIEKPDHLRPMYAVGGEVYGESGGPGLNRDYPSGRSGFSGSSQNSSRSATRTANFNRRSQGAFYISEGTVENREPGVMTRDDSSALVAEVKPAGPMDMNNGSPVDWGAPEQVPFGHNSPHESKPQPWYRSRIAVVLFALLLACVVGVGVAIPLSSGGGGGNNGPTPAPTLAVDAVRVEAVKILLGGVTDAETLKDETSPQFAAYEWIAFQDESSPLTAGGPSAEEEGRVVQRYSLAVFYYATGGEKWTESTGWLDGKVDECTWQFVSCVSGTLRQVSEIDTGGRPSGNNLDGSIPSEMRELSSLRGLYLPSNKDVTDVHPDLGQCPISFLELRGTGLQGKFPEFVFSLTNLRYLDLSSNELSGSIPNNISMLTALDQLYLRQNSFSGTITNQLGNLDQLRVISLTSNNLFGDFNDVIEGLDKLKLVNMGVNRFRGILDGEKLLRFPDLEDLDVGFNRMDGTIPPELGSLSHLKSLFLDENLFTGTIPPELANGAPLVQMSVRALKRLEGSIPEELCGVSTLQEIQIDCDFDCTCDSCRKQALC